MQQMDATKKKALEDWVADCADKYSIEYPIDVTERALACNVQAALKELGFDVSVSHAAAIWEAYSRHLQAGWLVGAESVFSAREILLIYCNEIAAEL